MFGNKQWLISLPFSTATERGIHPNFTCICMYVPISIYVHLSNSLSVGIHFRLCQFIPQKEKWYMVYTSYTILFSSSFCPIGEWSSGKLILISRLRMAFLWPASKLRETPFAETSMHFEILSRKKNSQAESHGFFQFFGEDLANVAKPGKMLRWLFTWFQTAKNHAIWTVWLKYSHGEILRCHYNQNTRDF